MTAAWHLMFWILLPLALYASIRAYDDYRGGGR